MIWILENDCRLDNNTQNNKVVVQCWTTTLLLLYTPSDSLELMIMFKHVYQISVFWHSWNIPKRLSYTRSLDSSSFQPGTCKYKQSIQGCHPAVWHHPCLCSNTVCLGKMLLLISLVSLYDNKSAKLCSELSELQWYMI